MTSISFKLHFGNGLFLEIDFVNPFVVEICFGYMAFGGCPLLEIDLVKTLLLVKKLFCLNCFLAMPFVEIDFGRNASRKNPFLLLLA